MSSSRWGIVVGRRPDGSSSPTRTSTRASAISWPPNQAWRTAGATSAQSLVTTDPELTTTTVRPLAAHTRRISSGWPPGRSIESRSLPSVSQSRLVPTTSTTASAVAAAATARSMRSSGDGVLTPTFTPLRNTAPSDVHSTATSTGRPATMVTTASASALPMAKNSSPGGMGWAIPSTTTCPSTSSRARPACTKVRAWSPSTTGVKVVVARNEKDRRSATPGTRSKWRIRPSRTVALPTTGPVQSVESK